MTMGWRTPSRDCPLCGSEDLSAFESVAERRYYECAACRLVHLDPLQRLRPDEERAAYELHENDPQDARYRAFLEGLAGPLAERLTPGARGLDYGCGPGPTLSLMLEERGFPMALYDPFFVPDRSVLQRRYDFVTCSEASEHFFSPATEFARLDALVSPGGWLGIMTSMLPAREAFGKWHYARDPSHVSFYARSTMHWLAARFGWTALFPRSNVVLFRKA